MTEFYRLTDLIPLEERKRLGVPDVRLDLYNHGRDGNHIMAVRTEEFRAPRKGEWYLSGAIPTVWRAPNDYGETSRYWIMRLVIVERTTTRTLKEVR